MLTRPGLILVLTAGFAARANEPKKLDWLRERLTDTTHWTCKHVATHLMDTDATGDEKSVAQACILTVSCTKNSDADPKKLWPSLLTIRATGGTKCPTVEDWIKLEVRKDDVMKGAPMMQTHQFTKGVANDGTADVSGYGSKCKFQFAPPFVVWRKFIDPSKKFDAVCTNIVSCDAPMPGMADKLEPVSCGVAKADGGCPSAAACVENPVKLTALPVPGAPITAAPSSTGDSVATKPTTTTFESAKADHVPKKK